MLTPRQTTDQLLRDCLPILDLLAESWTEHFAMIVKAIESGGEIDRQSMARRLGRKPNASMPKGRVTPAPLWGGPGETVSTTLGV